MSQTGKIIDESQKHGKIRRHLRINLVHGKQNQIRKKEKKNSSKSDRAKRALFMASPDPKNPVQSQNSSRVQSQSKPMSSNVHRTPGKSLPKPKVLITRSAKDTPLKAQELGTRSSRSKFRSIRLERTLRVVFSF